jgi:hypothetical protein
MIKIFIQTTLMIQISLTAWGGYVPPADSPYWCYQDCIALNPSNHGQCVAICYDHRTTINSTVDEDPNRQDKTLSRPMGAACCSWGENITGCMPGC